MTQNGKPNDDTIQNDENWKLLKFLCDRIEENNKKKGKNSKPPQSPKPIPITTNILARRKKKKKNKIFTDKNKNKNNKNNNNNINLLTTSPPSSSYQSHSDSHLHSKTKSQALYTSAFQYNHRYNNNSPKRTSQHQYTQSSTAISPKSQTPRARPSNTYKQNNNNNNNNNSNLPNLEQHAKSHSTQLPLEYIHHPHHHQYIHSVTHQESPPSPPSSTGTLTPSYTQQTVIQNNHSTASNTSSTSATTTNTRVTINKLALQLSDIEEIDSDRENKLDQDSPLSDPVQSLVTLVRRVTQKYSPMNIQRETKIADQETIRKVYDKYVEFYRRPPVYPDHLRKFANKFQGIHVTYAAAKDFLDSIKAIQNVTSPKKDGSNKIQQFRLSRSSISSPVLFQNNDDDDDDDDDNKNNKENNNKSNHNTKIDIKGVVGVGGGDDDKNKKNHNKSPFAFYNQTDLELLQGIKKKINSALQGDRDEIESSIHMVWEREYNELEKRLHRAYLHKPYNHYTSKPHQLKRDTTFLSLKQMSESTDIDDTDHDAAVFLLKTYFPDDDDDDDDDDTFPMSLKYSSSKSASHAVQKSTSSALPPTSPNRLKIKPQQQHIRSVTADKSTKPALYRRSTAYTETLSLYDTMVMKARKSKIKSRKFMNGAPITMAPGALKPNKSAPTPKGGDVKETKKNKKKQVTKKPKLETIHSQNSDHDNDDDNDNDDYYDDDDDDDGGFSIHDDEEFNDENKISLANLDDDNYSSSATITTATALQPYKLDDDDMMTIQTEITPEPPLFDPAFRQLTTLTTDDGDDGSIAIETSIDISTASISKQSSANNSLSNEQTVPRNLLTIMAKYGDEMESWDFDIFKFMDDASFCGKGLVFASFFLFRKIGLLDATGITQANLWRFLENVQLGYKYNPYHNQYHAVDVLLSTHYMFQSHFFKKHMTIWDQFGAYIAAVCHDLGHMGFNNTWYINTAGNLALLYGDESVLENYHIAETFRILNDTKNNWMLSFPSSVRRYLATVIRRTILATDLKVHGTKLMQLQNMVDTYKDIIKSNNNNNNNNNNDQHQLMTDNIKLWRCESIANYASLENIMLDDFRLFLNDKSNDDFTGDVIISDLEIDDGARKPRILGVDDERIFLLEITIHACDVANPCKPLFLAKQWANRFLREAFNQGDEERNVGIPVSAGMDRFTSKLATSQIGFITFVVKRLFQLYAEIVNVSQHCVDIMNQNEKYWIEEKRKMLANKQQNNINNNKPITNLKTINEETK